MAAVVIAVSRSAVHTLSKANAPSIRLLVGLGVEGDAHLGRTVKHRSRVARDPNQPNLRQVHLIHAELFDELRAAGFEITAGQMGSRDAKLEETFHDGNTEPTGRKLSLPRTFRTSCGTWRTPAVFARNSRCRLDICSAPSGKMIDGCALPSSVQLA